MKNEKFGYLYLLNTVILFSTFEVVSKTLVGKIDPFQMNFIRFFIGGLILFIFVILNDNLKIASRDLFWVTVIGILNVVLSMNFLQLGIFASNAKASVVAVIFSSNPIFVVIFSAIIDKEKVKLNKIIGMSVGLIGISVIFFNKMQFNTKDIMSPLFSLLSAIFYGLYTVLGRKMAVRIGSLKMNSYSSIIGSLILLPILLVFKLPVLSFDYRGIYQVLYIAVFVTGLAYLTYFKGLSIVGASSGSLVFFIKPVLASFIAIIFLKESATINLFTGTALILIGIMVVIYWQDFRPKFSNIYKLIGSTRKIQKS